MGDLLQLPLLEPVKTCTKCGQVKPLTEFAKDKRNRNGRGGQCRKCANLWAKDNAEHVREYRRKYDNEHRKEKRAYFSAYGREYRKRNLEKCRARDRAKYQARKEKACAHARISRLKKTFGLTIEQFNELLAAQGGVCAICRKAPYGKRRFPVDHDHVTGKIRGILCPKCNSAIGLLGEDIMVIARAIGYIQAKKVEA